MGQRKTIWTYFIQSGTQGPIKIGKSDNPKARLNELQTGCADELHFLGAVDFDCERDLHFRFQCLHVRGEWFSPGEELLEFIRDNGFDDSLDAMIKTASRVVALYNSAIIEAHGVWQNEPSFDLRGNPILKVTKTKERLLDEAIAMLDKRQNEVSLQLVKKQNITV